MIDIRPLNERDDLKAAVRLQRQIWGFEDVDLIPLRVFIVAQKIGGQVFGAFDGSHMIGFCLAIPGLKPEARLICTATCSACCRNIATRGVGRSLKLAQRDDALARGIELIEWTFDPLEIKNAFFNMERLGAIVRRYVLNQYGTTSSPLHGGLPTDRCIAEWWLASPRVRAILAGQTVERPPVETRIAIPSDIATIRSPTSPSAREKSSKKRATSSAPRSIKGLAVIGFEKSETNGTYLLGKWESA